MQHQIRLETQAGVLTLEAAAAELDLAEEPEAIAIMRNDALGAVSALHKDSFSPTFLQQCAMRSGHLERRVGCETLHLHAPGRVLIEEGVDDDLSLTTAEEVSGPVSSAFDRQEVTRLAQRLGWTLTVDAFS